MYKSAILATLLLLVGCTTQNVAGLSSYKQLPSSQMIAHPTAPSADEPHATIIVKRDRGLMGSELSPTFILDTQHLAKVAPGEYLELRVTPGEHFFGVALSTLFSANATKYAREIVIDCAAGKTYYIRLYPQAGNGIAIERSSQ